MLNNVAKQVNRAARMITLRHPNAIDGTMYYKELNRLPNSQPETLGGIPTIGGIGVLDSEDEADFEYVEGAGCKVVFTGVYAPSEGNIRDNDESSIYRDMPVEALVECTLDPADQGYHLPDKNDLIVLDYGSGVVMTYEVIGPTSTIELPPYTRKYALAPRTDRSNGL